MVTISFPEQTPAEASILAQDLRRLLLAHGVPSEALSVVTDDPETMAGGILLSVDYAALFEACKLTVELSLLSLHVAEILHRAQSKMRIATNRGEITIDPPRNQIEPAAQLIEKALRDDHNASP